MIELRISEDAIHRDAIKERALHYLENYQGLDVVKYLEFHGTGLILSDMVRLHGVKHVINHLTIIINELN